MTLKMMLCLLARIAAVGRINSNGTGAPSLSKCRESSTRTSGTRSQPSKDIRLFQKIVDVRFDAMSSAKQAMPIIAAICFFENFSSVRISLRISEAGSLILPTQDRFEYFL